jgi:hypothetical protein
MFGREIFKTDGWNTPHFYNFIDGKVYDFTK